MANLIRGLSENGGVVFCGVDSTQIVRKAEKLHTTSATCSAALGRLLTGAALMGSMLKDDRDKITLRVSGGGPAGVVIACTDGTGNVKGCIDNPLVELPAKPNGHLDVGGAVGKDGVLTVIRDNSLQKEPTVGQVPLVSGEIAEDLTAYYAYSEQVPTVMALGVLVDKDLSILCAGGFMVQLLPGATDAEIDQLEKNIAAMPSVTTMLHEGKTPEDMMQLALAGFEPNVLDERDVHYQCDCSAERTKEMLFSLGRKELVKMARKKAEDSKVAIRSLRRDANEALKKDKKASNITEDDLKELEKDCQDMTDSYIKKIEDLLKEKENEIMEV